MRPAHLTRAWPRWLALPVILAVACSSAADDPEPEVLRPGVERCGSPQTGGEAASTTTAQATGDDGSETVDSQSFATRPDLTPPVIDVTRSRSPAPGFIFLAPKKGGAQTGPLIVDNDGEVVWAHPREDAVSDFKVQTYRGKPVLTWWEGTTRGWAETGGYTVMNASYEVVAQFSAGRGLVGDFHDMLLTDDGTALMITYEIEPADLSAVDGPEDGYLLNNYIQEVDVETGKVLFEWSAADHVPLTESDEVIGQDSDGSEDDPYDAFHVNSVAEDRDGTLLVSARNTHALYSVDRATGDVRWTLGGRNSDFTVEEGAGFRWQHDARRLPNGRISVLDNRSPDDDPPESRVVVLEVDESARRARLVRELRHPDGVMAQTQANAQMLPGGRVMVGWGSAGRISELSTDGEVVFDAAFTPADSYRAFRFPWHGSPRTEPDVTVARCGERRLDLSVSWNGATDVARWRIVGGDDPDALSPIKTVDRDGFETDAVIDDVGWVAVEALDASGAVLATSGPTSPS